MSRDDKQVNDKYVAKPKSQYYDPEDTENTPNLYELQHATPSRLSSPLS